MTGLFDNIPTGGPAIDSRRCGVARGASLLDPEDAAALQRVVLNVNVPASAIRDSLSTVGIDVSKDSIWRHRRGDCKCRREVTT